MIACSEPVGYQFEDDIASGGSKQYFGCSNADPDICQWITDIWVKTSWWSTIRYLQMNAEKIIKNADTKLNRHQTIHGGFTAYISANTLR